MSIEPIGKDPSIRMDNIVAWTMADDFKDAVAGFPIHIQEAALLAEQTDRAHLVVTAAGVALFDKQAEFEQLEASRELHPITLVTNGLKLIPHYGISSRMSRESEGFRDTIRKIHGGKLSGATVTCLGRFLCGQDGIPAQIDRIGVDYIKFHEDKGVSFLSTNPDDYHLLGSRIRHMGPKTTDALVTFLRHASNPSPELDYIDKFGWISRE